MSRCSICAGLGHNKRHCHQKKKVPPTKFFRKFVCLKKNFFKNEENMVQLRSMYGDKTCQQSGRRQLPEWMVVRSNILKNVEYKYYRSQWEILLKKKYDLCIESRYLLGLIQCFNTLKVQIKNDILVHIFDFLYEPAHKKNYYQKNKYVKEALREKGFAFPC